MLSLGLIFRFEAKWEKESEVAIYLEETLPIALDDLPASSWYAVRFDATAFGVIAVFSDVAGEREHVGDRIAEALRDITPDLETPPVVHGFDVIAPKVPA